MAPCTIAAVTPRRADAEKRPGTPGNMTARSKPPSSQEGFFWKTKTLEEMSNAEWESLCDGCARCCLEKLEDEDTGKIYFTHVSCKLLDAGLCACKDYANRSDLVPDCVRLTPAERSQPELAAAKLRLSTGRGRARSLLVASADFRRPRYGSRSGRIGAGQGAGDRERGRRRRPRGSHRAMAGAVTEACPAEEAATILKPARRSITRLRLSLRGTHPCSQPAAAPAFSPLSRTQISDSSWWHATPIVELNTTPRFPHEQVRTAEPSTG